MANLKDIKKGDKVIMRLFTGAFSGAKVVEKADKDYIYFETRKGMSKFSKKTGKIIEPAPKSEAYASYIEEYDADIEASEIAKKEDARTKRSDKLQKEKSEAKAAKKAAKKPNTESYEDDEEETPKKTVRKAVKKDVKKSTDDEYEEVE